MTKQLFLHKKMNRIFCTALYISVVGLSLVPSRDAYGNAGQGSDFSSFSNPVSGSPVISPTTPVSSYNTSVFPTSPIPSTRGNMIITGNVGGLEYFHGYLPYTAQGNFTGRLESTSLDSFLRYSTPTGQPFYSPTASLQVPVVSGTTASDKIRTPNFASQTYYPQASSTTTSAQIPDSGYSVSVPYSQYQTGLLGRVSGYKAPEEFLTINPQTQTTVPIVSDQAQKSLLDILKPSETTNSTKNVNVQPEKTTNTYDQIKAQIDQLNQQLQQQGAKEAADQKIKETIEQQWKEKIGALQPTTSPSLTPSGSLGQSPAQPSQTTNVPQITVPQISLPQINKLQTSTPQTTAPLPKTRAASGSKAFPRTPEVEKQYEEKSRQYLSSAYQLLREQNFYQAADTFTWASLYKPSDPNGYVGKAVALFAAGEYMTASRLVAAGLNLSADFAKTKLDLAEMLGGKEKLDSRIADLDKSSKNANSGELYFLLAYIQYKTEQSQMAKASIDEAERKLPNEEIVKSLKNIINQPAAK
jgi:tetratricopeptide (TPR) repeat protein